MHNSSISFKDNSVQFEGTNARAETGECRGEHEHATEEVDYDLLLTRRHNFPSGVALIQVLRPGQAGEFATRTRLVSDQLWCGNSRLCCW